VRQNPSVTKPPRRERDLERRETVERYHQLKDVEEDFDIAKAATSTREERQELMNNMAAYRRKHREEDVERGKRPRTHGSSSGAQVFFIQVRQNWWARWIEVAVDHEFRARRAYDAILASEPSALMEELRLSLVAVTAAAYTVEAVYEDDIKYLIPEQPRVSTSLEICRALVVAFGLDPQTAAELESDLDWLFDRRNDAVHPYSESEPPRPHPSGLNTSAEASRYNARESGRAVDIAMKVLGLAAAPPNPQGRWVSRWVDERQPYHTDVVSHLRARRIGEP
jgi:hypothetical protein